MSKYVMNLIKIVCVNIMIVLGVTGLYPPPNCYDTLPPPHQDVTLYQTGPYMQLVEVGQFKLYDVDLLLTSSFIRISFIDVVVSCTCVHKNITILKGKGSNCSG